jgi:RHS repeat-associated protein
VWSWDNTEPFGDSVASENPSGLGTFTCNLRFPGQYFDRETNTHYNYFRDYDPAIGRYVQSDLIGLDGGVNTYAYVKQDPIRFKDPSGLVTGVGIAIGGLCIVASGTAAIDDLMTLREVIQKRNEIEQRIKQIEASCPPGSSKEKKIAAEQAIQDLRRQGSGLLSQIGATGLRLGGVVAVGLVVCPALALLF